MIRSCIFVLVISLVAITSVLGAEPTVPDFQRDVLPIFENHCFQCHDGRKQTAGLRLDVRSKAMQGGDSGDPAIVPKISEQSEIILRVTTDDADAKMPPEGKGQPLSTEEIAIVRNWIDGGANWPDAVAHEERLPKNHWAYIAPVRPELPAVKTDRWVRNPIDRFVLARLEAEGITPPPEADRSTLLRRMSLDLVGLPPSLEELDKALANPKTDRWPRRRIGCWPRPIMENAGVATGSMPHATPIQMATKKTNRGRFGFIAIGSSMRSIAICRTTSS